MRRLVRFLLILFVLLILGALAVPFLVPADRLKGEVLARIEAHTGRKVTIDHLTFAILPEIALDAEGVKVSNPDWAGGGNLAEIKTLKLGLELFPLLHKEIRLKELTLDEPVLLLVKSKGRTNWDFSRPATGTAAPAAPENSRAAKGQSPLDDLHLDKITIKNGSVTYKDDASPRPETVTQLDFTLKAPNFSDRAVIELSALYDNKKADISLTLARPLAFKNGEPTEIDLKASYSPYDFTYAGTAKITNGVPDLTGKLVIPSVNTNDFAGRDPDARTGSPASAPSSNKPANASRWSDAPIRLEGLARANANLEFSIGTLTLPKTMLKDIHAALKLQNGSLQFSTNPVSAYGGTIQLSLAANTRGAMNVSFSAAGAEAEPLLHDLASYDRLSGTIDLKTAITANGLSQRALVNSLGGSGNVQFRNGKLKGVNLAAMLRRVTGGAAQGDDQATDFSELSGSFAISRGVVSTNDFKMNSPLLRVTGSGTADLPDWQEHFLLKPMLVASTQGQGGTSAPGIVIPVKVEGPLDHPHYEPDFAAALQDNLETLKNPQQLKQGLKDLKTNLLNGKSGGGLQNLLR